MTKQQFLLNFYAGIEALKHNKFRAILTSLGIIFGVAAVIAMLAIGKGTEIEIMKQLEMVGSNNILVSTLDKEDLNEKAAQANDQEAQSTKRFSSGLTLNDVANIQEIIPEVNQVSPEIENEVTFSANANMVNGMMKGIGKDYFNLNNLELTRGIGFSQMHYRNAKPVCLINRKTESSLFSNEGALGKKVNCNGIWLTVIGVYQNPIRIENAAEFIPQHNKFEVLIPIQSMLIRFENRALPKDNLDPWDNDEDELLSEGKKRANYHQLDRLILHVDKNENVVPVAKVVSKLLKRRHNDVEDFEIVVPELLLKQQQENKALFNKVLGLIAGISLLVGGIGIMNIMLASVMERIKEIGIRMSMGAGPADIVIQFLSESVLISLIGGIFGIILGVSISFLVEKVLDIETIITWSSVLISFFISAIVGIAFGYYPAKNASEQRPIESLRHE